MPTARHCFAALLASASVALCAAPALAQNAAPPAAADEARTHFDRGLTLLDARNFEGALAEFQRSYQLSPRPSVLYNIAVTLQSLNRYPEAAHSLEQYLHDATNLTPQRRAEIQQVLEQLRGMVSHVTFDVGSAGATVRLDGVSVGTSPLSAPVDVGPGRHAVEVLVGGRPAGHTEFTIASGENRTVHLDVAPAPTQTAESDNPYGDTVTAVHLPTLRIDGVPNGGVATVDGRAVRLGEPVELPAGSHAIIVQAPHRVEYHGSVEVRQGEHRRVNVRMADTATGLPPGVFYGGVVATAAFGIAAAIFGGLTLDAQSQFNQTYADDPAINDIASRGNTYRDVTNGMLLGTGIAAVITVVAFTQTHFSPAASTADVAVTPLPGGAAAAVRIRF